MQWLMHGSIGLLVWSCLGIFPAFANSMPQSSLPQLKLLIAPATLAQQPDANKGASTIVRAGAEIRLKLDRLPNSNEGTLAVFLDQTDITSQIQLTGNELVYQPTLLPLTPGDYTVTLYLVKANNQWHEFATVPIKVEPIAASSQPESPSSPSSNTTQSQTPQPSSPQRLHRQHNRLIQPRNR